MKSSDRNEKILIITGSVSFGEKSLADLKKRGYESVYLVKNGVEGLKSIYDILPHLVILDVSLPGMSGYDILKQKSEEPLLVKVPVFLISSQGVPINMRSVPAGSVTEFLSSLHISPQDIGVKVDRHFKHEGVVAMPEEKKPKVLWVEDDKLIASILSKKIQSSGFDLVQVRTGSEALEILKTLIPDIIIIDLTLPGTDGFEILQKINMEQRMKSVPKMVLTNLSKPSDLEKARLLGVSKFLVKAATSLDQIVKEMRSMLLKS